MKRVNNMTADEWRLVNMGPLSPLETQTIWHAGAIALSEGVTPNTLFIDWTAAPLVGCGFHQEIEKEVDLEYCQKNSILVARRSIGGGAVYLDKGQIFYHLVIHKDTPDIPLDLSAFYELLLRAPVKTYRDLGIPAHYRPVNDIIANGRKISGNGGGLIQDAKVLCGNLILTFDYDKMAKVLRVPSQKFKDRLAKSLREWVTTIERELGYLPERSEVVNQLVQNYEETLKVKLIPGELTQREKELIKELNSLYHEEEWLFMTQRRHPQLTNTGAVKIREGTYLTEAEFKAPGGLVRVTLEIAENKIHDIMLSGDFWIVPESKLAELEKVLLDLEVKKTTLLRAVQRFYLKENVQAPGLTPEDIVQAIILAKKQSRNIDG